MAHMLAGRRPSRLIAALVGAVVASALLAITAATPAYARNCAPGDPYGTGFYTALKANSTGKFVSAELGYSLLDWRYGMLRARPRQSTIGSWERFYVLCLGNGTFALQASNRRWVSVETNYTHTSRFMLRAYAKTIGARESFTYRPLNGDYIGDGPMIFASTYNGRTVSAEFGYSTTDWRYGMLRARDKLGGSYSGSWEIFTAYPL